MKSKGGPDVHLRRVFRFAPSPNGYLHRGHALSALLNARAAEATGGRLLLRIEDVDPSRTGPEFQADDSTWLGIKWETPVLRQSERFDVYRAALRELDRLELVYPSFLKQPETATRIVTAQSATSVHRLLPISARPADE